VAAHQAPVPGPRQPAPAAAAAPAAGPAQSFLQPADSQATMASAGAAAQGQRPLQSSPEVGQQPLLGQVNDVSMPSVGAPAQQAASEAAADAVEEQQGGSAPDWLVQGITSVAERSQGSRDRVEGRQLLGRRWVGAAAVEGQFRHLTLGRQVHYLTSWASRKPAWWQATLLRFVYVCCWPLPVVFLPLE